MEFSTKCIAPGLSKSGCTIVGVFESRKLSAPAAALDRTTQGYLSKVVKSGDMEGRAATTLLLHHVPHAACERVLLVGLGPEKSFDEKAFCNAVSAALRALNATGAADADLHLTALAAGQSSVTWRMAQSAALAIESVYRFEQMKSKREAPAKALKRLLLAHAHTSERKAAELGLTQGQALGQGVSFAKDLGNLPGNVCTPTYLAAQARELAKRYRLKIKVLESADMKKLGMGALLSVARGSAEPPKLIVLEYHGGPKNQKPVVLVGKN